MATSTARMATRYTQCWIDDKHIYSVTGGYIQCWIDHGYIYGAKERLPWVSQSQRR
jgi:hypothetical protein